MCRTVRLFLFVSMKSAKIETRVACVVTKQINSDVNQSLCCRALFTGNMELKNYFCAWLNHNGINRDFTVYTVKQKYQGLACVLWYYLKLIKDLRLCFILLSVELLLHRIFLA